ncbi:hypothetical protein V8E55_008926 [Tylopilus felleus]
MACLASKKAHPPITVITTPCPGSWQAMWPTQSWPTLLPRCVTIDPFFARLIHERQALLPVRIGLSLYLSPAFSRGIIEPVRRRIIRPFKKATNN